jgi:glycogen phosphorylase
MALKKYVVVPRMERGMENLRELALNLWFSWTTDAVELFDYLDERLWEATSHNPVQTLIRLSKHRLNEILQDEGFLAHAEKVTRRFRAYIKPDGSYEYRLDQPVNFTTAYFSLEFGLTECLPIYSGGLGVLAGDHLKSSSDLSLPLVGVGLLYREGYFRQKLTPDGWQQEYYPRVEVDILPLEKQMDSAGEPLLVSVDLAGETLWCRVMKISVGRVPLYLLDADIPENSPRLRATTARLYGGDAETRIRQEILLGIGGCRALAALGIDPMVFHLNEGHAAFTLLERMRYFMEEHGLSIEEAREMVTAQSILTVHTPVPAGNDVFDRGLVEKYFGSTVRKMGMDFQTFLRLGRRLPLDDAEGFCMTVLGLRMTARTNGVSQLHSRVAKDMWREVWPKAEPQEVPINHVTNGIHIPSYISRDLLRVYDRYLGPGWTEDPDNEKIWQRTDDIPDTELWRTHERCRTRLVQFARRRIAQQLKARNAAPAEQEVAEKILDPDALTICFARRFATYKRATLLFREPDRLAKFLSNPDRPAQLIFAGKAHPADNAGKEMIRKITQLAKEEPFRNRMAFIEDYDLNVARYMVQGADIWLNTPTRPLEACGTSGMKAAANGALNVSILDGWWDEGYIGDNGWAIGRGEEYNDKEYQDAIESRALYDLLEESVKPLFYERGVDELPREWIRLMRRSLRTICPVFNSHRMVSDYVETCYVPAAQASAALRSNDFAMLRSMVAWKKKMAEDWDRIIIKKVEIPNEALATKGKPVEVIVSVDAAGHGPDEVKVELLHGPIDLWENFKDCKVTRLDPDPTRSGSDGEIIFSGLMPLTNTGLYGYMVRLTPEHSSLPFSQSFELVHRG